MEEGTLQLGDLDLTSEDFLLDEVDGNSKFYHLRQSSGHKTSYNLTSEARLLVRMYVGYWLLAYHYSQPPSALGLSNIGLGSYLDG